MSFFDCVWTIKIFFFFSVLPIFGAITTCYLILQWEQHSKKLQPGCVWPDWDRTLSKNTSPCCSMSKRLLTSVHPIQNEIVYADVSFWTKQIKTMRIWSLLYKLIWIQRSLDTKQSNKLNLSPQLEPIELHAKIAKIYIKHCNTKIWESFLKTSNFSFIIGALF